MTLSTFNSAIGTILGVYSGPELDSLKLVAESDDSAEFNSSPAHFTAVAWCAA